MTVLLVSLVFGACSSTGTIEEPDPETIGGSVPTILDLVEGRVGETIDLQTAIDAFSLAFTPLPGSHTQETEVLPFKSGSGPLRWLLGHWDDLTIEQQRIAQSVIDRLAAPPADESATTGEEPSATAAFASVAQQAVNGRLTAFATGYHPEGIARREGEQALALVSPPDGLIAEVVAYYETKLGWDRSITVAGKIDPAEKNLGVTVPRDAQGMFLGDATSCTIAFSPEGAALTGPELEALVAHEVFHCFEADQGVLAASVHRPPWIVEGMAEWFGEAVSGGSDLSEGTWTGWLATFPQQPLFDRSYTAIGFYAHLADTGVDMWSKAADAILASDQGSSSAYQVLIADGYENLIDSWSAGYFREADHAPDWDQAGPGITGAHPKISMVAIGPGDSYSGSAKAYGVGYSYLDMNADVVTFSSTAAGEVMFPDGASVRLNDLHGVAVCTKGASCTCPDGSAREGAVFLPSVGGLADIAITGHTNGGTAEVTGWALSDFCASPPPDPGVDACLVGTWRGIGYHASPPAEGAYGIELIIAATGQSYINFSEATPIYSTTTDGVNLYPLKFELGGSAHFTLATIEGESIATSVESGTMTLIPYSDFGDGWFKTGPGINSMSIGGQGGHTGFVCNGTALSMQSPIGGSEFLFEKISSTAELPAAPAGSGSDSPAGGDTGDGSPSGTLPDIVDVCGLLTIDEVRQLVPEAKAPSGEDALGSSFVRQCTFEGALSLQLFPPSDPDFFTSGMEMLGNSSIDVDGIGDWALTIVTPPDPTFGIEGGVLQAVAGSTSGSISIVLWNYLELSMPEYDTLLGLLTIAIGRL